MYSAYDFHKGFDSRWYVTHRGVALYAYPSKAQAIAKFCVIRKYETLFARDYGMAM